MNRRALAAAAVALFAAAPLHAQGNAADPDKKVEGGSLPAGWTGRTDRVSAKLADAKFAATGPGFHVSTGPAAIYWNSAHSMSGPFSASATFTQTKAPAHPEAYGVFFAGNDLIAPEQTYFYFLVRGDGKVTVKHRAGAEVHTLVDWTDNAAVQKQDAAGKATNTLRVDASKPDSVRLSVNGAPVVALAKAQLGAIDGTVGLRVNHNLDVRIADFTVTSARSASMGMKKTKAEKATKKATKG